MFTGNCRVLLGKKHALSYHQQDVFWLRAELLAGRVVIIVLFNIVCRDNMYKGGFEDVQVCYLVDHIVLSLSLWTVVLDWCPCVYMQMCVSLHNVLRNAANSFLRGWELGGVVLYLPLLPCQLTSMLLTTWNSNTW